MYYPGLPTFLYVLTDRGMCWQPGAVMNVLWVW